MQSRDSDILEYYRGVLSPIEMKALRWITLDPTRPYCSKDLIELVGIRSKGTARNINWRFKKLGIIELYCKSINAFYKLKSIDKSQIKKPVTLHRMGDNGLRHLEIDFPSLLSSFSAEELCRVHDVRLAFSGEGLYDALVKSGNYKQEPLSKDLFFGSYIWSKYRSLYVILHSNGKVSFLLKCSNYPIEASTVGFVCMAAFLGGIRERLLSACKAINQDVNQDNVPYVEAWKIVMWHYGKDSAQEFSGEAFNITFKMWCGELARIYVHEQDHSRKIRFEVVETPKKPLQEVIANKLNLCCSRCSSGCSRQSL